MPHETKNYLMIEGQQENCVLPIMERNVIISLSLKIYNCSKLRLMTVDAGESQHFTRGYLFSVHY